MDKIVPPELLESLLRSKAQIEAGETVPLEPFMARLRASIARMEAKQAMETTRQGSKRGTTVLLTAMGIATE